MTGFVLTADLLRRVRVRDVLDADLLTASAIVLDHAGEQVRTGVYVLNDRRWVLDHRRDPDADCDDFEPGLPAGDCMTDGHYMCRECRERDPEHVLESEREV